MEIDLDTFLTTVYCHIDDLYQEQFASQRPRRPGAEPEMSDSEVLTIGVLAQWYERSSERGFGDYVRQHWQRYFPRMLSQSALNRRIRDLTGVLHALGPALGAQLAATLAPSAVYEVMDGVPVPLMRRCRGERHRLFGTEAGIGRGGSDREWYYGVRLVTLVNNQGLITGFVLGPAPTEEHWLADALLRWRDDVQAPAPTLEDVSPFLTIRHERRTRRGPTGPLGTRWSAGSPSQLPIVADLGYRGEAWRLHWSEHYHVQVLTQQQFDTIEDAATRTAFATWLHRHRQIVETSNGLLDSLLHLKYPGARTLSGLHARIGAKIAAYNLLLALNARCGRPLFAHANPMA